MGWMCVNMLRQYMGQTWADTDTGPAWKAQLVSSLTDAAVLVLTQQQIQHMSNTAKDTHPVCMHSISQNMVEWCSDTVHGKR